MRTRSVSCLQFGLIVAAVRRGVLALLALVAAPLAWCQSISDGEAASLQLPKVDLMLLAGTPAPGADLMPRSGLGFAPRSGNVPLNLGLHMQPGSIGGRRIDAVVWRRVSPTPQYNEAALGIPASYGAQVEMQLSGDRRVSLRDLLGLQMDNGARISLRRSNGKLALYYRVQF